MIDLHFHILPDVDDGPHDLAEAVAMGRLAAAQGTATVVATPHHAHPVWPNEDLELLDSRRAEVSKALGPVPRILRGAEIRVTPGLLDDLDRLGRAQVPSLGGSRYLLLEFARGARPDVDPPSVLHELGVAGWFPIVAHPEFVPWLAEDLASAAALAARGALYQVTAMSVCGDFGARPAAFCAALLEAGLAQFVASDAHGVAHRPPGLRRARAVVSAALGVERAAEIFDANPEAVLADRPLGVAS